MLFSKLIFAPSNMKPHLPLNSFLTGAVAYALLSCLPLSAAITLNANLLTNPDAEDGAGANNFNSTVAIPGWTTTGGFTAVQYAIGSTTDLNSDRSDEIDGDLNYFAGGPGAGSSTATQSINISDISALVDSGGITARLSAFIGGFASQNDRMEIFANFLDASESLIGSFSIGPVTNIDRNNNSSLLFRTDDALVPVGTRGIEIVMQATIAAGSYNDGYADNLNFQLIPEPSIPLLAALAFGGVIIRRRKPLDCSIPYGDGDRK